jgi:hypothetical protein
VPGWHHHPGRFPALGGSREGIVAPALKASPKHSCDIGRPLFEPLARHKGISQPTIDMDDNFKVERWDDYHHIEKTHAICECLTAARGAFHAVVAEWPDKRFTLRNGARVILEHPKPQRDSVV